MGALRCHARAEPSLHRAGDRIWISRARPTAGRRPGEDTLGLPAEVARGSHPLELAAPVTDLVQSLPAAPPPFLARLALWPVEGVARLPPAIRKKRLNRNSLR